MTKLLKLLVIAFLLVPLSSYSSEKAVLAVMDDFSLAIENKDKPAFLNLFVKESASWIGVFSNSELEQLKNNDGDQGNIPGKLFHSSPEQFIDWVIGLEGTPGETFDEVKLFTDGEVASLYFDYQFYLNGKVQNWGSESWLLVNSEDGWKIQAVNFSYTSGEKP